MILVSVAYFLPAFYKFSTVVKMSLKVIHTKPDGTKVPIKVSIWEAFRGVPDPKPPKPKPVSMIRSETSPPSFNPVYGEKRPLTPSVLVLW